MDIYEGNRTLIRQDLNNIEKGDWVVVSYMKTKIALKK